MLDPLQFYCRVLCNGMKMRFRMVMIAHPGPGIGFHKRFMWRIIIPPTAHNRQHLFVMDLVVPLCVREALRHKAYWVEQPILLLLQQDSPCGKVRCIALQSEETGLRGERKHRGRGDGVLQCIKGLLLSCAPRPVLRLPSEHMKGVGDFGEVPDEPPVEVHEPYEGLDILYFCRLWPVSDPLDLNGVHRYVVLGDDNPKVVHLSTFEFAFLWLEKQLIGVEGLEYLLGDSTMVCEGGGVNEDVINVAVCFIANYEGGEDGFLPCIEVCGRGATLDDMYKRAKQPHF